jgi:competence protein ComEA
MIDRRSVVAGAVLFAAAALGAVFAVQGSPPATSATTVSAGIDEPATAEGQVVVQVSGYVSAPGVFRLPAGSIVADAVLAAGGAAPGARLDALDLARGLTDGDRIVVPGPGAPPGGGDSGQAEGPLSLNSADAGDLEELPGIGPVLAERIVEYRESHGPFEAVEDLLDVSGIGEAVLGGIRDLVVP